MAEETQVIVELTQYTLHALRAAGGAVEAGGECALENKTSVEALLDAVAPARKAGGVSAAATVWPPSMSWYLSTDTEAMLDRTGDAMRAIAAGRSKDPAAALAYAACNAGDGGAVTPDGTDKWIMAFTTVGALEKASTGLLDLKVDPQDVTPAVFPAIGAVAAAISREGNDRAVALWDLGAERSHLLLVTARGVEAAVPCAVGMETVIEAVQAALKLKFRGAGARLFFNDTYDFTDPGPRIGAALAAAVKEALGQLPATPSPPALACVGLTGRQAWFVREVAAAAGMAHWQPDAAKLAGDLGITFSDTSAESGFSAASVGLFGLLGAKLRAGGEWSPAWVETEAVAEPAPAEQPEPEPEPEPEPIPEPEPVARPAAPPVRVRPTMSIDTGSGSAGSAPKAPRPTVSPKSVSTPPAPSSTPQPGAGRPGVPVMSMRPPSAQPAAQSGPPSAPSYSPPPQPGQPKPPASAFPAPPSAPARAPSFSNPGFPMPGTAPPGASDFPSPPSAPARAPSFSNPGFPMPGTAPPGAADFPAPPSAPGRPPSFSNPGFPTPETQLPGPLAAAAAQPPAPGAPASPGAGVRIGTPAGTGAAARAVTALPFEAVKLRGGAGATTPPIPEAKPEPKSKVSFYIGIVAAAALLAAGIAVVLEARMERARAYDLQQQQELALRVQQQQMKDAAKAAEEKAEQDRKDMEAAVAEAKKEAEENTRREVLAEQEAARVAKLPGTILVATTPAGASVSIDGGAPLKSPARAEQVPPGSHHVTISLQGFDPVDLNAEVKGTQTTDLGSIALQAAYGSLDLTSTPDSLEFALRPAADPAGKPVRTGRTPASVTDVTHGDYLVTYTRPGCRDHVEKVTIEKGVKSTVDTKYLDGSLDLTSDPSGASVNKDGEFLGTTPLSLHDLTPKTAAFDLTLPGYDPTPISCEIPEGQTLTFSARLLRKDRVFGAGEVKTPPVPIDAPQPSLSAAQRKLGADILLSLVVTRNGLVSDVEVVRATDDDVGRRCKSTVEKWRYRPATAPDDRTVDAKIEVPFKFPASP